MNDDVVRSEIYTAGASLHAAVSAFDHRQSIGFQNSWQFLPVLEDRDMVFLTQLSV
jgi:hypothetical protein